MGRKADGRHLAPHCLAYGQVVREFIASLGPKAGRDISQVSKADVARYRDAVQARTSVATANKLLKYLRVALGAAWKDGLTKTIPRPSSTP